MRGEASALFAARVLVGTLFLAGAVQKGVSPGNVIDLLAGRGWPEWLVWPTLVYDAGVALLLFAGIAVRPVALSAAAYCAVTSLFHFVPEDGWQMSIFVKNWAIAGGCLALAVAGAGRWRLGGG
ncbi:DoxX family protein [Wenxinia marina]|uniref:Putative membrane protein n=1 Tax=Wenxinia marina DSM 24838 TaxID=1123501 RepID=A0A0D0QFZ5_9RHOB|nr:DoxX family membrane protein [Wenxinia marina]KIQ69958.1 putative membrane protein [Wenxinia marina DSM 24838]GGL62431.1 hypothetical protein GCM10011392_16320 [Wenxinia marina]